MWLWIVIAACAVTTLGIGSIILCSKKTQPGKPYYLASLVGIAAWNVVFGWHIVHTSCSTLPTWHVAIDWIIGCAQGVAVLGFSASFLAAPRATQYRRLPMLLAISLLLSLPLLLWQWMTYHTLTGLRVTLIWLLASHSVALASFAWSIIKIRGQKRLQLIYILLGTICLFFGYALELRQSSSVFIDPVSFQGMMLRLGFPLLCSYALLSSPLVGFNRIVRIGVINLITLAANSLLFAIFCQFVYNELGGLLYRSFGYAGYTAICVFVFTLMIVPLRNLLLYHRRFMPKTKSPQSIMQKAITALANAEEPRVQAGVLTQAIHALFHPTHLTIYLINQQNNFERISGRHSNNAEPTALSATDSLVLYLLKDSQPKFVEDLVIQSGTAQDIGLHLQSWGASMIFPVFNEKQPVLVLSFGGKQSGYAYTAEDCYLLRELCTHAATAFTRSSHFNELLSYANTLKDLVSREQTALRKTQKALEIADQEKDNFLAVISHELLTPLTSVMSWVEIAQLHAADEEIVHKALDIVMTNAKQQKRLLKDLLDASRLTHGKLTLESEHTELWSLVAQSAESMQQVLNDKQIILRLNPPENLLPIFADPQRIVQVVTNLLTNAMKFTPRAGSITVTGSRHNGRALLTIADTGRGIPPEELSRLFGFFEQGPQEHVNAGLGLGLALVKGITELHGGTVKATSQGIGHGCTFTIELPLDPHASSSTAAVKATNKPPIGLKYSNA